MRQLDETYSFVLSTIGEARSEIEASRTLNDALEACLRRDEATNHHNDSSINETNTLFRGLAEVSKQTDSPRVGRGLSTFFLANAPLLFEISDNYGVVLLSHAIHRAIMPCDVKIACQVEVLREFPDIVDMLRRSRRLHAATLRSVLIHIANTCGPFDYQRGPRSRNRRWDASRPYERDFERTLAPRPNARRRRSFSGFGNDDYSDPVEEIIYQAGRLEDHIDRSYEL